MHSSGVTPADLLMTTSLLNHILVHAQALVELKPRIKRVCMCVCMCVCVCVTICTEPFWFSFDPCEI